LHRKARCISSGLFLCKKVAKPLVLTPVCCRRQPLSGACATVVAVPSSLVLTSSTAPLGTTASR
ncbi:MAG: hypothetical protein ACI3ZQ_10885, partial [Candidatus Cryptobacteroides sp.]